MLNLVCKNHIKNLSNDKRAFTCNPIWLYTDTGSINVDIHICIFYEILTGENICATRQMQAFTNRQHV